MKEACTCSMNYAAIDEVEKRSLVKFGETVSIAIKAALDILRVHPALTSPSWGSILWRSSTTPATPVQPKPWRPGI